MTNILAIFLLALTLLLTTAAAAATWTQTICSDPACSENCFSTTYTQGDCYPTEAPGTSAKIWCTNSGGIIKTQIFPMSSNCSGFSYVNKEPAGVCSPAQYNFVIDSCSGSSLASSGNFGWISEEEEEEAARKKKEKLAIRQKELEEMSGQKTPPSTGGAEVARRQQRRPAEKPTDRPIPLPRRHTPDGVVTLHMVLIPSPHAVGNMTTYDVRLMDAGRIVVDFTDTESRNGTLISIENFPLPPYITEETGKDPLNLKKSRHIRIREARIMANAGGAVSRRTPARETFRVTRNIFPGFSRALPAHGVLSVLPAGLHMKLHKDRLVDFLLTNGWKIMAPAQVVFLDSKRREVFTLWISRV